jgi:hypothetical protein
MIVNFRACEISRGARKLTRTSTSSRYLTRMRIENQGEEFKFTTNVVDSTVLFSILYHDSDWLSLNSSTATILSGTPHYLLYLCILETRGFLFLFLFLFFI